MTTNSKEMALASTSALAEVPINIADMEADVALGGKLGMKDISIPYVYIMQTNSPQVNPDNNKYIQGAVAGMILLTNLDIVFEGRNTGLKFVPCYYERKINEWVDRDKGGGLVGSYGGDDPIMNRAKPNDRGQMILPNGHMLVDTAYHYVLVHDEASNIWHQAVMPLKSTALKHSRRMNSTLATTKIPGTDKQAPRFLHPWIMKTTKEQKDTNVWSAPAFEPSNKMVSADVYAAAKAYAKIAGAGLLRRSIEETEVKNAKVIDDEIPF
ncbi:MAG: hypothetical protein M3P33_04090 [bacterium]|nr:hypothetical protein [bacterium]